MLFSLVVWESLVCQRGLIRRWATNRSLEWVLVREGAPSKHHTLQGHVPYGVLIQITPEKKKSD